MVLFLSFAKIEQIELKHIRWLFTIPTLICALRKIESFEREKKNYN